MSASKKAAAAQAAAAATNPNGKRWDTPYCFDHADKPGSCTRTDGPGGECPFPHLTETQAKQKAQGHEKVFKAGNKNHPGGGAVLACTESTTVVIDELVEAAEAIGDPLVT